MFHPVKVQNMQDLAVYRRFLWDNPQLRFLFFELTDQCNLNCLHCGSGCTGSNHTYLDYELIERTMKSVAERYDPSQIMICLTGGEPMLSPDVFKVIAKARQLGFYAGMTSNGTLIDQKAADKLALAGLNTIAISIDGLEDTHDAFRQSSGCFARTLKGVDALRKAGIEPQAITVIHKNNYHQLEDMYQFFRREGFYSWRVVNIEPIGRANDNNDLLLEPHEMIGLLDFIREKRFDNSNPMDVTYGCSHFLTYDYENETRDYYFHCSAGTRVASIMANGDIGACLDIERRPDLVQGNAYHDSFVEVWENRFDVFRRNRAEGSSFCSGCEHKDICMGDSAHTWNYDENKPNYCIVKMMEGQI